MWWKLKNRNTISRSVPCSSFSTLHCSHAPQICLPRIGSVQINQTTDDSPRKSSYKSHFTYSNAALWDFSSSQRYLLWRKQNFIERKMHHENISLMSLSIIKCEQIVVTSRTENFNTAFFCSFTIDLVYEICDTRKIQHRCIFHVTRCFVAFCWANA